MIMVIASLAVRRQLLAKQDFCACEAHTARGRRMRIVYSSHSQLCFALCSFQSRWRRIYIYEGQDLGQDGSDLAEIKNRAQYFFVCFITFILLFIIHLSSSRKGCYCMLHAHNCLQQLFAVMLRASQLQRQPWQKEKGAMFRYYFYSY